MPFRLLMVLLLVFAAGCGRPVDTNPDGSPRCDDCNVIVVTFDALRADHLGVYGYPKNTSPNLDAFAAQAYVYTDVVSQTGTTVPSLASIWTSRYPYSDQVFVYDPKISMSGTAVTLAEILKQNGFHTAAVIAHHYAKSEFGFHRGFDIFEDEYPEPESAADAATRVLSVMDRLRTPFFLWVHFRHPHTPYEINLDDFHQFYDRQPGTPTIPEDGPRPILRHFIVREPSKDYATEGGTWRLTPSMVAQYVALYDGNIRRGDEQFGVLMQALEQKGLTQRTIVLVAADHGESQGEHLLLGHNTLWYGILRTPLLLRLPTLEHQTRSYPVTNMDIYPTILGLLGLEQDRSIRGRSLFDEDRQEHLQISEYEDRKSIKKGPYRLYLQAKDDKVVMTLYDVVADPAETEDLSDQRPELVAELLNALYVVGAPEQHSETMEQLRALGYIQ